MITEPEPITTVLRHRDREEIHILQDQVAGSQVTSELDAKGLLLRDALAIVTVVGALVAFYGMIKLVSYLAGIPSPLGEADSVAEAQARRSRRSSSRSRRSSADSRVGVSRLTRTSRS